MAEGFRESLLLLRKFLRSPRTVGAVTPSSRALARAMIANLPINEPASIVELGPGTGAFTGAILDRVGPKARVLAMELEPEFVDEGSASLAVRDLRLRVGGGARVGRRRRTACAGGPHHLGACRSRACRRR